VPTVLIVDNSTHPSAQSRVRAACETAKVTLIANKANLGIAAALNQAAGWAIPRGFAALALFDQDSEDIQAVIASLLAVCQRVGDLSHVAMIGANAINKGSGKYSAGQASDEPGAFIEREAVLLSGSLVLLEAYRALGPFVEEFFIDTVDIEYGLRAKAKGYRILQALKPTLTHSAGHPKPHTLFGKTFWTLNHTPSRYYYMMRNTIGLMRTYPGQVSLLRTTFNFARVLLFEEHKLAKLQWISKGLWHGLRGVYVNPAE
jgi:rhamnosyltransferase